MAKEIFILSRDFPGEKEVNNRKWKLQRKERHKNRQGKYKERSEVGDIKRTNEEMIQGKKEQQDAEDGEKRKTTRKKQRGNG